MSKEYTVDYAFTITLKPLMFKYEPDVQYDHTNYIIRNYLSYISDVYTLVAELTRNANIHYHGIIKFKLNRFKDINVAFHKLFRECSQVGYVNILQITDKEGWVEYIKKDLHKTKNAISRRPIIEDIYGLYNENELAEYAQYWNV